MWKNNNTGEEFAFWNNEKIYSENAGGILAANPSSSIISPDVIGRLVVAANPFVFVGTQKYNDISCYTIKFGTNHEIIDKNTGMVIYSGDESFIRNLEYSFNTVTDEDIAKPNLSEYTIKK